MHVHHFPFKAMGSPCELRLYAGARAKAERVSQRVITEVRRLESKYSRYRDDSIVTRINRQAGNPDGIEVDNETAALLDYAQASHAQSDGLFDITSGILRRVWDFKSGRVPEQARIDAILELTGWEKVVWEKPRLILPVNGMELDFGGYVKEYTADVAANLCRRHDIEHGLVDLGGDIKIIGPHPDGSPWRVGIRHPRDPERAMAVIERATGGVASSGDYERFMIVHGKRYCHVLNPHTGWPVNGLISVSVVADQCVIAGTASTVAMLKGERSGAGWLDELGLPNLRMNQAGEISGTLEPNEPSSPLKRL